MSDDTVSKLLESLSDEQKSELIQTILNSNVKSDEPPAEGEREEGLFVMNKGSGQVDNKTPATGGNRFNKFRDDGDEHKDEQNETPSASLTERRRSKFKKVEQICQRCKTTLEIHPQFARDFFVCDQCLKR